MFDIDSDRFIKPAEEEIKKFLDAIEWDKIAEEVKKEVMKRVNGKD